MNKTIGSLQERITKLVNENVSMEDEVRNVQENLRLSASQNQKIAAELNEYKMRIQANNQENESLKIRIQKLGSENTSLSDEVRTAQDNLRLSANQQQKMAS